MTPGTQDHGVMERECGDDMGQVPPRLEEEIGCAARSDVPVLITGSDPEEGREIACAIDRQSGSPRGSVEVVDCRERGAFSRLLSPEDPHEHSILLLQEVHALSLNEQAEVDRRLTELRATRQVGGIRIIASSSTPLFDRVREGSFDERLYYRLNVIHMVVA